MNKLSRLAQRLLIKHATIDAETILPEVKNTIQTAVSNASTVPNSGLMPFIKMLKEDKAALSVNVIRNGPEVSVSQINVSPGDVAPKYAALSKQIEDYLTKNLDLFPTTRNGQGVNYNTLTIPLQFDFRDGGRQLGTEAI